MLYLHHACVHAGLASGHRRRAWRGVHNVHFCYPRGPSRVVVVVVLLCAVCTMPAVGHGRGVVHRRSRDVHAWSVHHLYHTSRGVVHSHPRRCRPPFDLHREAVRRRAVVIVGIVVECAGRHRCFSRDVAGRVQCLVDLPQVTHPRRPTWPALERRRAFRCLRRVPLVVWGVVRSLQRAPGAGHGAVVTLEELVSVLRVRPLHVSKGW